MTNNKKSFPTSVWLVNKTHQTVTPSLFNQHLLRNSNRSYYHRWPPWVQDRTPGRLEKTTQRAFRAAIKKVAEVLWSPQAPQHLTRYIAEPQSKRHIAFYQNRRCDLLWLCGHSGDAAVQQVSKPLEVKHMAGHELHQAPFGSIRADGCRYQAHALPHQFVYGLVQAVEPQLFQEPHFCI